MDQNGHAVAQPSSVSYANPSSSHSPSPSPSPKPDLSKDGGTKVAWTGKFVSAYGGYADDTQGLIFKRTDGEGGLHHFTPAQTMQLRASNKDLIDDSMRNGSQGKDVKVTFSVDNGRGSWGVQQMDQNQQHQQQGDQSLGGRSNRK